MPPVYQYACNVSIAAGFRKRSIGPSARLTLGTDCAKVCLMVVSNAANDTIARKGLEDAMPCGNRPSIDLCMDNCHVRRGMHGKKALCWVTKAF